MHGLERRIADNMHLARRKGDVSKRALLAGSSAADDADDVWVGKAEAEVRARYAAVAEDSGVTYWGGTGRRRLYFALRDGTQVWFELDFAGAVVAAGGPEPKARWQRHSGDSITVEQRAR